MYLHQHLILLLITRACHDPNLAPIDLVHHEFFHLPLAAYVLVEEALCDHHVLLLVGMALFDLLAENYAIGLGLNDHSLALVRTVNVVGLLEREG